MLRQPPQGAVSLADIITANTKNYYRGKKISILGDSLCTFTGYVPLANRCRYPQNDLLISVEDTWWKKLINELGLVLGVNESWAGSRVSWDGTTESTDIGANKHIASVARIQNLGSNGTPDIIIVWAGSNDALNSVALGTFDTASPNYTPEQLLTLDVSTFANAFRTMLVRLLSWYPTSKIIVMFPTYATYTVAKLDSYNEIIRTACDFFGINYIDVRTIGVTALNRLKYLPDGVHPNALGMKMLYEQILKAFVNFVNLYPALDYGGDATDLITYYAASTNGFKATDNLYTYLKEKTYYYNATNQWVTGVTAPATSINFKVSPGDHIIADSFQAAPANGHVSINGVRIGYLYNGTIISTVAPADVYAEYNTNGYITVPEGVNEISVGLWIGNNTGKHWVYNQSLPS